MGTRRPFAGEDVHFRDVCIEAGCVESLLRFVTPTTPLPLLHNIAMAIKNLCRSEYQPSLSLDVARTLLRDALPALLCHKGPWIPVYAVITLSQLVDTGGEHAQLVVDSGVSK